MRSGKNKNIQLILYTVAIWAMYLGHQRDFKYRSIKYELIRPQINNSISFRFFSFSFLSPHPSTCPKPLAVATVATVACHTKTSARQFNKLSIFLTMNILYTKLMSLHFVFQHVHVRLCVCTFHLYLNATSRSFFYILNRA